MEVAIAVGALLALGAVFHFGGVLLEDARVGRGVRRERQRREQLQAEREHAEYERLDREWKQKYGPAAVYDESMESYVRWQRRERARQRRKAERESNSSAD